jgi:hypothetical protein
MRGSRLGRNAAGARRRRPGQFTGADYVAANGVVYGHGSGCALVSTRRYFDEFGCFIARCNRRRYKVEQPAAGNAATIIERRTYAAGGRLQLIPNRDGAIEYQDLDSLGRPRTMRSYR